jgi:hypothetical protein
VGKAGDFSPFRAQLVRERSAPRRLFLSCTQPGKLDSEQRADGDALVIGHHRIGYINTARTQGQVFDTPGFDAPSFGWVASTVR